MKIMVAMSGGVDSSVVAHLLHEAGHEIIGVMMQLWTDPLAPDIRGKLPKKCCSIEHIQRARSVCNTLGVPFYVLNLEEEFKSEVIDDFLEQHKAGNTPNPCVGCNRTIKFGHLLKYARSLGCEAMATGHYAQIAQTNEGTYVKEATDKNKDQSYFLYTLDDETLNYCLFPLGALNKTEVFAMAKRYKVPLPDYYSESQDLCFYPEKEPGDFLRRYLPDMKSGNIELPDGTTVGRHEGLPLYTIGQRKRLGIGGLKIPLYVSSKNITKNTLIVEEDGLDKRNSISILDGFIKGYSDSNYLVRVSSLGTKHPAEIHFDDDQMKITFTDKIRGLTPGQSAVIYAGGLVMGGGVIESVH